MYIEIIMKEKRPFCGLSSLLLNHNRLYVERYDEAAQSKDNPNEVIVSNLILVPSENSVVEKIICKTAVIVVKE